MNIAKTRRIIKLKYLRYNKNGIVITFFDITNAKQNIANALYSRWVYP